MIVRKSAKSQKFKLKNAAVKLLLSDDMDHQVQIYITNLRKSGGWVVNTAIVCAVGMGIVMSENKQLLSENGDPITLTKTWAYSLLQRMNFVKRRGSCTAKTYIPNAGIILCYHVIVFALRHWAETIH